MWRERSGRQRYLKPERRSLAQCALDSDLSAHKPAADITAHSREHSYGAGGQQRYATNDQQQRAADHQKLFLKSKSHCGLIGHYARLLRLFRCGDRPFGENVFKVTEANRFPQKAVHPRLQAAVLFPFENAGGERDDGRMFAAG